MTAPLRLEPGTLAPDFTLTDHEGASVTLSELGGQKTILYFYGEAMTPGCTTQACDFRDSLGDLAGAGYRVIGISRDAVAKLERFAREEHLTFPLLSDPDHAVHDLYGTFGEKQLYGNENRHAGQHPLLGERLRMCHLMSFSRLLARAGWMGRCPGRTD